MPSTNIYEERLKANAEKFRDIANGAPTAVEMSHTKKSIEEERDDVLRKSEVEGTKPKPTNPKDAAASTRLDVSVFPQTAIAYGALGMTEGGYKYAAYNYREAGVNVSVYYSALMRHMFKFYNGEWADPVTKVPHLASALSCIAIIIDGYECKNITDDRPPPVDMDDLLKRMQAQTEYLQRIFPDIKPRCTGGYDVEQNTI